MLDVWGARIEVVQEPTPLLVGRRQPKALFMSLDRRPFDQEDMAVGPLDAPLEPEGHEAWASRDDGGGLFERRLEQPTGPAVNVEYDVL